MDRYVAHKTQKSLTVHPGRGLELGYAKDSTLAIVFELRVGSTDPGLHICPLNRLNQRLAEEQFLNVVGALLNFRSVLSL